MAWQASQVELSYDAARAIPTYNEKYQQYIAFKQQFGEDGNAIVIGIETDSFYNMKHFATYKKMLLQIKKIDGAEGIAAIPLSIDLVKNDSTEKLMPALLFPDSIKTQENLDSAKARFENLVFYRQLLYNPVSRSYLAAITINKVLLASSARSRIVKEISDIANTYERETGNTVHISGLPLIKTQVADRIKHEMGIFLIGGLVLQIIVLLLFFRSISATIMSLFVVVIGVVWSFGTMHLFGYKITALTSLIGPLIIVIGIPNCIYFLNKYHTAWQMAVGRWQMANTSLHPTVDENLPPANHHPPSKSEALCQMVSKMGIVTLFCNIAAAIGFAVFSLTSSALLKEFGIVAGINIMALFFISLIFIPAVLSFLPKPKPRHVKYLDNPFLEKTLVKIEHWVLYKKNVIYTLSGIVVIFSVFGMFRLKAVGFMLDDLPKQDKVYTDLKWFEHNFGGVMPLEIIVDTKKKNGLTKNLKTIQKIDELSLYIDAQPECARPLSLVEGLKFVKQAYYNDDSLSYAVPTEFDMAFLATYLKGRPGAGNNSGENTFSKLLKSYMDSTRQKARVTVNMADIGTERLPIFMDSLKKEAAAIFDSSYNIQFTGGTVTYLEGSKFIIHGLRDSIIWSFLLIAVCMLYLFRSVRILLCSLIPNLIPLICTAGLMGWAGVPLKPSTVLVFSVALGIAIDVTIRFLVNFKQELPLKGGVLATSISTIKHTGISIIYTSLVLVAGFIIFCFSSFGGTVALGWLTSFTLVVATFTNLVLLPALLLAVMKT